MIASPTEASGAIHPKVPIDLLVSCGPAKSSQSRQSGVIVDRDERARSRVLLAQIRLCRAHARAATCQIRATWKSRRPRCAQGGPLSQASWQPATDGTCIMNFRPELRQDIYIEGRDPRLEVAVDHPLRVQECHSLRRIQRVIHTMAERQHRELFALRPRTTQQQQLYLHRSSSARGF